MVEQTLRDLGLNPNEVKIYLSLLPLEKSPASTLGYRTKLERTTARYTCRQLVKKGVIAEMRSGNTFYYRAESPDKLLYLLESEKKELQEKEAQTQRIMGMLKGMANPKTVLPKVRFYEGKHEIRDAYLTVVKELEPGDVLKSFAKPLDPESDPLESYPFIEQGISNRIDKEIFLQFITPKTEVALKYYKEKDKDSLRETRFLPLEMADLVATEITLAKNKIFIFSASDTSIFCFEAEQEDIAKTYHALFDLTWNSLKN